jgi:hypothetical protein
VVLVVALLSRVAAAGELDGKWKQGPLKEEFTVQRWVESACGPPPISTTTGGGEAITIGTEGDELSLIGGGRVFKSNQCYDQLPTLVRDTHSRDPSGKVWRTRCSTPPSDPRRASMNTLIQVTNDSHIDIVESGRYEIVQGQGASCIADVKRTRTFDRIGDAPVATATTATATATQPRPSCATPGDPARLEIRPSRKLLRTGESFTFSALVLDANGCATNTATTWKLAEDKTGAKKGVNVDDHGKVAIDADAPEGPVEIEITAAGKTARVTVEVSSPSHYDALLQSSGLNPSGETDTAAVVVIAEGTIGGADVRVESGSRRRKTIFLTVIGVLTLAVGIVGILGWRRSRRAAELRKRVEERHSERVREHEETQAAKRAQHEEQLRAHEASKKKRAEVASAASVPVAASAASAAPVGTVCPSCRREFPPDGSYCPHDGNRLVPLNVGAAPRLGVVCPTCSRGFDAGVRTCPDDGSDLVPYAMHTSVPKPAQPKLRKICPTCGAHFEGGAGFCGKDGTTLVLLN